MRRKPVLGFALALLTAGSLSACGNSSSGSAASTSSSETTATTELTTSTSTTTTAGPTGASIPATSPKKYLIDTAVTHTDGKDRIALTFNDGTPGYAISYVTPPITDEGEGKPVTIAGAAVLKIALESSATTDLTGGAKNYYTGKTRITPTDTNVVVEAAKVSEYEGRLLWGVGTKSQNPFTVSSNGNVLTITFG